jgi:hypothetical protein
MNERYKAQGSRFTEQNGAGRKAHGTKREEEVRVFFGVPCTVGRVPHTV